jgi:hypothetical protein
MIKVYCEHGALTGDIKQLRRDGIITLVHFPYDPDSRLPNSGKGVPSGAKIKDLHMKIKELPGVIADYSESAYYGRIAEVIGVQNRRDALHIDSALKSGCLAMLTNDSDILNHRSTLEAELPLRFFHPERDILAFRSFLDSARDVNSRDVG